MHHAYLVAAESNFGNICRCSRFRRSIKRSSFRHAIELGSACRWSACFVIIFSGSNSECFYVRISYPFKKSRSTEERMWKRLTFGLGTSFKTPGTPFSDIGPPPKVLVFTYFLVFTKQFVLLHEAFNSHEHLQRVTSGLHRLRISIYVTCWIAWPFVGGGSGQTCSLVISNRNGSET